MPYVIGTDEAGYGPNLGPLVVAATIWQVPDVSADLYQQLSPVICRPGESGIDSSSLIIGDSKEVLSGRRPQGYSTLERSVLAMIGALCDSPLTLDSFLTTTCKVTLKELKKQVPYSWTSLGLPQFNELVNITPLADSISQSLNAYNVRLHAVRADCIFPDRFNDSVASLGNKANLLSSVSCRLVNDLIRELEQPEEVLVHCDKHGGRSHYAGVIQQEITESFVTVVKETRSESLYRWREQNFGCEMAFSTGGERHLPVALASMLAKYIRELSMLAWNMYWRRLIPDLKPTAGYPVDAKRFKSDIASKQAELGLPDHQIWRCR